MLQNLTKRQKRFLGFSIFILLVAIGIFIAYSKMNSLKNHAAFTTGHIYDVTTSSKSPEVYIRYRYVVGQKQYDAIHSLPATYKSEHFQPLYKLLLNKSFPVAYDSTDCDNSEMLVAERQYKMFRLARPDSLKSFFQTYDNIVDRQ